MRINKFLSLMGVCSRREADRMIASGKVYIGKKKALLGDKVLFEDKIYIEDKYIGCLQDIKNIPPILLAVNKPRGIVCSSSDNDKAPNIVDMVDYTERIYPIGRLDKDSEGLILMTNQGELVNSILKASNYHEKEYIVSVDKEITEEFIKKMSGGVFLKELNKKTRPCRVCKKNKHIFHIILTQGLNRQIRRMCGELGYQVLSLKRIRILNIELGNLQKGAYRELRREEIKELYQILGLEEGEDYGRR